MSKAFIELKFKKRVYKLRITEIHKMYKVEKRMTPPLPSFLGNFKNTSDIETDHELNYHNTF